jgi:hypothetical protein
MGDDCMFECAVALRLRTCFVGLCFKVAILSVILQPDCVIRANA